MHIIKKTPMHTAQKIFNGNRKLPANETEAPDYVKENGTLQSNICCKIHGAYLSIKELQLKCYSLCCKNDIRVNSTLF